MFPNIFKTKSIDEATGKPNVIALMFSDKFGLSVFGGALAPGCELTFGNLGPFIPQEWELMTQEEYQSILEDIQR